MPGRFYFDHNATTPLSETVWEAMSAALKDEYGNASSIHHFGQMAKLRLETARRQVAGLLGASAKDVVFVSGGTEADNLALLGASRGGHLVTTSIEHPAVLACARRLNSTLVAPSPGGVVAPEDIKRALRPDTTLVSVMHANNETGVLQPIAEIAAICRAAGVLFHSDGVQAAGKVPVRAGDSGADLYSISAHKINGPKGAGALYVRPGVKLDAQIHGGRHERERRAGTENVPAMAGFGCAAEQQHDWNAIGELRDRLERGILRAVGDTVAHGANAPRLPNTSNIGFDGIQGEAMVIALDLRGFAVSSGSACSSGAVEPSHVLLAMGLAPDQARSSLRFSLGLGNTAAQVDSLIEAVADAASRLRRVSATYSHAG